MGGQGQGEAAVRVRGSVSATRVSSFDWISTWRVRVRVRVRFGIGGVPITLSRNLSIRRFLLAPFGKLPSIGAARDRRGT